MRRLIASALLVGVMAIAMALLPDVARAQCSSVTVGIATSGDDAAAQGLNSASYPPSFTSCNTTATTVTLTKTNAGGGTPYSVRNLLLQWDTAAALPGGATITGATLRLRVSTGGSSADSRSLVGEWFDWGATCSTPDYNAATENNAHSGTSLTAITASSSDSDPRDFALSNLSNISQTGGVRTYMKIGIDGGQPTGTNTIVVVSQDNTTLTEPQLVIDYCTGATSTPTSAPTSTATATSRPRRVEQADGVRPRPVEQRPHTPTPTATSAASVTPTATARPRKPEQRPNTPTSTSAATSTATATPKPRRPEQRPNTPAATPTNTPWCGQCTLWIGFSQAGNSESGGTAGWFKSGTPDCLVDSGKPHFLPDAKTELRWCGGCGVERYSVPEGEDFNGADSAWDSSCSGAGESDCYYSECSTHSTTPDRVVFVITDALVAPDLDDAADYQPFITDAIDLIRSHYPGAAQIVLQSVVGGPNGGLCYCDTGDGNCSATSGAGRTVVRSSANYPIIVDAIFQWLDDHPADTDVVAGAMPTVTDCAHFSDTTGHFTTAGACAAATTIAEFYEQVSADPCGPTATPTATATPQPTSTATATRTATTSVRDVESDARGVEPRPVEQRPHTPTATVTLTRTATRTLTTTETPTETPTQVPTSTSTRTFTLTPTPTSKPRDVEQRANTPVPTSTATTTRTPTRTDTPTITRTPTVTPTGAPASEGAVRPVMNVYPPRKMLVEPRPTMVVNPPARMEVPE